MKKKMKIIGIVVLAATLLVGAVSAQGYGRRGGGNGMDCNMEDYEMSGRSGNGLRGRGGMGGYGMSVGLMRLYWNLDLTDNQEDEIEDIMENARDRIEAIMDDMPEEDMGSGLIELYTSPNLSVSDLEDYFEEKNEFQNEIRGIMFQALVEAHDVLTDEQLEELAELAGNFSDQGGSGGSGG